MKYCNGRKKKHPEGIPKLEPGLHGGEWYCKAAAGAGTDHPGEGRCKHHGGASLRGFESPKAKHLRYSRDLPTRLAPHYHEALQDEEALALRSEIALIDTRISELLPRLETGETEEIWKMLKDARAYHEMAEDEGDEKNARIALRAMYRLIDKGGSDFSTWKNIVGLIDRRRKLVESDRRRLVQLQQVITYERAMTLVSVLVDIIQKNVDDPNVRRAISGEIRRVVIAGNSQPVRS